LDDLDKVGQFRSGNGITLKNISQLSLLVISYGCVGALISEKGKILRINKILLMIENRKEPNASIELGLR